ncbi:SPFH domain, Band 7 family protein [[Leptolyngbya] sp. PCC 7376]|uniref:prohibitin family protein n=1 Tax=[Leptolyngbya] sp. PCC 7376 TaxID=111781 RepID=UPI00029F04C8|nr:prohibitin family protein [[Leptolyngbya] sp. PCC 7376]AFY38142.1 SPFH domain, Band 7 family protein [[Leptolyngbya] sp. PCC 7376]
MLDTILKNLRENTGWIFLGWIILFAGGISILNSFAIVKPGNVGVKVVLGKTNPNYLPEGFHLKLPFITEVATLSIQQQSLVLEDLDGSSSEGNNIFLDTQLTYSLKPTEAVDFYVNYKTIGNFQSNFLSNIVQTEAKSVLVRRNLQKTIAERERIDNEIEEAVFSALEGYPQIAPKRVQVQDLDFAQGVIDALEQKEIAQQKAQEAIYKLEEAKKVAEATVAKAEGQAKAQKLLAQALQGDGGELSLKRQELENQHEMIKAWEKGGSQVPTILNMGSGESLPLVLDVNQLNQGQ